MKHITGKKLKKARYVEDMTQEEAAELIGIHRSYLSQIENGKVTPSPQLQKKISELFEETIDKFLFID